MLIDGELQSRTWHGEDGTSRTVVEIKAHRIQFLNKQEHPEYGQPEFGIPEYMSEYLDSSEEFQYAEAHYSAGFNAGGARDVLYPEREESHSAFELRLKPRKWRFTNRQVAPTKMLVD